jgi:hypothetical protein
MSHQIIKQPNGLYAIFSTVVDDFIWTDCTPEDIIEMRTKEAVESIRKDILDTVSELESGGKPYYQFTMTFDEAVDCQPEVARRATEAKASTA